VITSVFNDVVSLCLSAFSGTDTCQTYTANYISLNCLCKVNAKVVLA